VLYRLAVRDQPVWAWPRHGASASVDEKLSTRDHSSCRVRRVSQQSELCFELVRQPFVIVIEQRDHIARRRGDSHVSRTGAADATRSAEDTIRQTGGRGGQFGAGFAVVDHDQFNASSGALGADAAQSPDEFRSADRGHDDTDRECGAAADARVRSLAQSHSPSLLR
jgi:hypothetical protein